MMRGTTGSTFEFGAVLVVETNAKEVEIDEDTGAEVGAFFATLAAGFSLARERTVEVAARRFPPRACLSVPSCLLFSLWSRRS